MRRRLALVLASEAARQHLEHPLLGRALLDPPGLVGPAGRLLVAVGKGVRDDVRRDAGGAGELGVGTLEAMGGLQSNAGGPADLVDGVADPVAIVGLIAGPEEVRLFRLALDLAQEDRSHELRYREGAVRGGRLAILDLELPIFGVDVADDGKWSWKEPAPGMWQRRNVLALRHGLETLR
jgi:hypothetical protein